MQVRESSCRKNQFPCNFRAPATILISRVRMLGAVYSYVVDPAQAQAWVDHLSSAVRDARMRARKIKMEAIYGHSKISMLRAKTLHLYQSNAFQCAVAFLIVAGFFVDVAEAQVMPREGSEEAWVFLLLDIIITGLFVIELAVNIFAHSYNHLKPFLARPGNIFDALIVVVSVVNILLVINNVTEFPNARLLRLVRTGRVVRLFSSLSSLQKILAACSSAVLPVCNAFLILVIIAAVYAIVGTNVFSDRSPEYFGNFHTSLFTMFQVLSGDSWASGVARSIFNGKETGKTGGVKSQEVEPVQRFVNQGRETWTRWRWGPKSLTLTRHAALPQPTLM